MFCLFRFLVTRPALLLLGSCFVLTSYAALPTSAAVCVSPQWSCYCPATTQVIDSTSCTVNLNWVSENDAICTPTCHTQPSSLCWSEVSFTVSGCGASDGTYTLKATAACETEGTNVKRFTGGGVTLKVTCANCIP